MIRTSLRFLVLAFASFTVSVGCGGTAWAQELSSHSHISGEPHFSHPLVSESPSPDTKARLDYFFANEAGTDRHTVRFEAEYAFTPWLSLEVEAPYTFLDPHEEEATDRLVNVEVRMKYANFTFAEYGLLLGGGIKFGLPTGNEEKGIGSDHVLEVEPFVDFGYRRNRWEIVGFTSFSLPVNENGGDGADLGLGACPSNQFRKISTCTFGAGSTIALR